MVVINAPRELSLEESPAWPYEPKASPDDVGFYAILEEGDEIDALEDQVLKLGEEFDRASLEPFYQLLWHLNRGRQRTFQAYLGFLPGGFFSEILLSPIDLESVQPIIDLDAVQELALDFAARFKALPFSVRSRIALTPLGTKFGIPPVLEMGFSLRLTMECIGDTNSEALAEWVSLTSLLVTVFEKEQK